MQARRLTIHNFRSIADVDLRLDSFSVIVGYNNAGKSNLVDAIRVFYGALAWDEGRDLPKGDGPNTNTWIEIEFDLDGGEFEILAREHTWLSSSRFSVRRTFWEGDGSPLRQNASLELAVNGVRTDGMTTAHRRQLQNLLGSVVYVPAVSQLSDHTKLSGPSSLRDLISGIMSSDLVDTQAYRTFLVALEDFRNAIRQHEEAAGHSLSSLEGEISQELAGWGVSFSLGLQDVTPQDVVKTLLRPRLVDHSHGQEVDGFHFGAGFQRHLVQTLIRLAGKNIGDSSSIKAHSHSVAPFTWLLFEEPEAFLHPSQQEVLHQSLRALSNSQQRQVLVTTHSPEFIKASVDDLTRLVRLRRDGSVTRAFQISQVELDRLLWAALQSTNSIQRSSCGDADPAAQLSAYKMQIWLQQNRVTAFLATHVLLVEGVTELVLCEFIKRTGRLPLQDAGVVVVDCMGKWNLHWFISLFGALGIDHSVLLDSDQGAAKHDEVVKSIQAARSRYTRGMVEFPIDLESALGLSKLPYEQRAMKPYIMLYALESGQVDESKLGLLIDQVRTLVIA